MSRTKITVKASGVADTVIDDIRSYAGYILDEILEKQSATRNEQRLLFEACNGDERKVLELLDWLAYEAGVHVGIIIEDIKTFSPAVRHRTRELVKKRSDIVELHQMDLIPVQRVS